MNDYRELIAELKEEWNACDRLISDKIAINLGKLTEKHYATLAENCCGEMVGIMQTIDCAISAIEQLVKERDEWMGYAKQERKRSIERYHELAVELDRVKKERDAAVADLKEGSFCMNCKHLVSTKEEKPCRHCSSLTGGGEDNWEWRGERSETDVR